ncbi:MAG TPA: hypothetical protein VN253_18215 [Kofleriaceae bacterium]|nr:hypothetical protein [Kofleriaceae bacterium]
MRTRALLGIIVIGSVAAYLHRRRGGEWSVASFRESGRKVARLLAVENLLGNVEQRRQRGMSDDLGEYGSSAHRGGIRQEIGENSFRVGRGSSAGIGGPGRRER